MKKIVQGWFIGLVLSLGLWLPALGQVSLLSDINILSPTQGSDPKPIGVVGSTIYFLADDKFHGYELWKTDGSAGGTQLVKDINPGDAYTSFGDGSASLNGDFLFIARNVDSKFYIWKTNGTEAGTIPLAQTTQSTPIEKSGSLIYFKSPNGRLWKTDGTLSGTALVTNTVVLGNYMLNVNGTLFFEGSGGGAGMELWKTDGTEGNTFMIKDINPSGDSDIRNMYAVGSTLYFSATNGSDGLELWRSNGSTSGTVMVYDLNPGSGSSSPGSIIAAGGIVYFLAEHWPSSGFNTLCRVQGTNSVTELKSSVSSLNYIQNLFPFNSALYFTAYDETYGSEIWKTDGTVGGTVLTTEMVSGKFGPRPQMLFEFNNTILVNGFTNGEGGQLMTFDGTSYSAGFYGDGGSLYYYPGGTHFYFRNDEGSGAELYKSDGTNAGTTLIKDITSGNESSSVGQFYTVQNKTYFMANNGIAGSELWQTTGTGASLVKDINPGVAGQENTVGFFIEINNELFFSADAGTGVGLWKTNGTFAGTIQVKSNISLAHDYPWSIAKLGTNYFFSGRTMDGLDGAELWKSDGTDAGTTLVKNIFDSPDNPPNNGSSPTNFVTIGSTVLFHAYQPTSGWELWKTDGTEIGTVMVKEIYPGDLEGVMASPLNGFRMVAFNDNAYFTGWDPTNGRELFKSDGTDAGTVMVKNIHPTGTSDPKYFFILNNTLYFFANAGSGYGLWKTDGTTAGTVLVRAGVEPNYNFRSVTVSGSHAYFISDTDRLWRTDGTTEGTIQLIDIGGEIHMEMAAYPPLNMVVFVGKDATGSHLWYSDGRVCGTQKLTVSNAVSPEGLTLGANNKIYFTMVANGKGREPFVLDPSQILLPLSTVISAQPVNQTKNLSTSTTFTVTATGTNLTYQWKKDGNNITNANATSYTISSVASADAGSYSVEVSGTCGTITSNAATLSVFATQPSQPTALSINTVTSNGYTVSWTPPGTAPTGYLVVRKPSSTMTSGPVDGTVYVLNASIGAGTVVHVGAANSFEETGLANNTIYYYEVYAYNGSANAATLINYNTTSPITGSSLPAVPVSAAATNVSQTGFTANWAAGNAASSYKLDVSPDNFANFVSGYQDKVVSGTSDVVTGLNPGSTYQYRVRATSFSGTSGNSSMITQLTRPANPVVVASTPTQAGFTLSWSAITSATSYQIEIDNNTDFSSPEINTTTSSTSITPTTLSSGTTYSARVRAVNATGASENSNAVTQLTLPGTPVLNDPTNISNASFKVSWPAVSGTVANYKLEISTDDFISFVAGYNPKTISGITEEIVQGLTPATVYKVRVRSVNASGESPNSDLKVVETSQASPIVITYGSPITTGSISISISGGVPPYSSAKIFYRGLTSEDETFLSKAMTAGSTAGTFSSSLTTEILTDDVGLEYYVEVDDDGTLANNKTANNPKFYREFTSGAPLPLEERFGNKLSDYQMFSIPLELADNDIEDIFTLLGTYDKTKWRIFHWNANTQTYLENTAGITKIDRGKGYWLISATSASINTGAADAPQGTSFTLNLKAGWNQIGNPYPFEISWADVLEFNGNPTTVGVLNFFKGASGYTNTQDNFPAYAGAFVHADADVSLTLPTILKNGLGGRKNTSPWSISSANIDSEEWLLGLQLQKGEQANQLGAFGMHPEANESKDAFDGLMVPRFMDYLETNFYHPEFFTPRFARDVVTTKDTYTWTLTIESGSKNELTQLTWDKQALMNTEATLFLIDEAEGIQVNMKERSSYTFTLGEKKSVKIFYSRTGADYQPERLVVGKAYPNPFHENISIPFSVSHAEGNQTIKTSVVDMNGREVSVLANQSYSPGFYELQWNGRDDANQTISAGLYLVKFTTANGTTKVSRVIKH